jgi:hypothetical protein
MEAERPLQLKYHRPPSFPGLEWVRAVGVLGSSCIVELLYRLQLR